MEIKKEFKINKERNFSEWYNTIIYQADLVDNRYNIRGFIVHKPWAMFTIRNIYRLFEEELEKDQHLPVSFPVLIPSENFEKEKEHVEGFLPEVFWVTKEGENNMERPLAMRPTSETAFYQMYSLWLQTHADLPMKYYQSCSVYRAEKETNPFMRGREFMWIETHDVFRTETDARKQIEKDINIMADVLSKMGITPMLFLRPKWDTFAGAEETYAYDVLMPDGKVLQVGSTHYLGKKFAIPFGIRYKDENANECIPYQTCFGPGIWRIMAALIITHGDEKGLIFPANVSPVQIVIVPINREKMEKITHYCRELKTYLKNKGYRVELDESEKTPGYKFNYWEMKGVPIRLEVGQKEVDENNVTVVRRDTKEKIKVLKNNLITEINQLEVEIIKNLKNNSEKKLNENVKDAKNTDELKEILKIGGYARADFCSIGEDGKKCADELKTITNGGRVRGISANKYEKTDGKCIICGKMAKHVVYIAKQY